VFRQSKEERKMYWDAEHPYRWRTWIRTKLPFFLINLGIADKGEDCEKVGGSHWWYNKDGVFSACYHCKVERIGRLWEPLANTIPNKVY